MRTLRHLILIGAIGISMIGSALLQGGDPFIAHMQVAPIPVNDAVVREGVKVTVQVQITSEFNPDESYFNMEQFIQGDHTVPPGIETQVAGMHNGEIKTFPLSAEEGFGLRDETKLQLIPTIDLPPEVQEGDTIADNTGRYAQIILILPELTLIDFNHPLAGQPLLITLRVMMIEKFDGGDNPQIDEDTPSHQFIVCAQDDPVYRTSFCNRRESGNLVAAWVMGVGTTGTSA
jgi:peptidylprolyl isomerase